MPEIVGILHQSNLDPILKQGVEQVEGILKSGILEYRADTFPLGREIPGLRSLIQALDYLPQNQRKKVLLTVRLKADGGNWAGSEAERESLIRDAVDEGLADWVDMELESLASPLGGFQELLDQCRARKIKILLSHHNLREAYSMRDYRRIWKHMSEYKPDGIKFAVTARDKRELLSLLRAAQDLGKRIEPSGFISMGDLGPISRVGSPMLGASLTYGTIGDAPTVSGQLAVDFLADIFSDEAITRGFQLKPTKWISFLEDFFQSKRRVATHE